MMKVAASILAAFLFAFPGTTLGQTTPDPARGGEPAAAGAAPETPEAAAEAGAEAGSISIELNKLESTENACRGYFVVDNRTPEPLDELQIDVFLFDKEGVILRRVALSFLDVRSGRTKVVLFDLADLSCGDVGRLLVNEVLACKGASGEAVEGCGDMLDTTTRAEATFEY
jgi:hypothetical protein